MVIKKNIVLGKQNSLTLLRNIRKHMNVNKIFKEGKFQFSILKKETNIKPTYFQRIANKIERDYYTVSLSTRDVGI
jgi:hypothetical protein